MDKGKGWVSMTLNSPMIENGNSPECALTLCLVEDDDSHDVVKTHFGKFFQAFFPEPDECIREQHIYPTNTKSALAYFNGTARLMYDSTQWHNFCFCVV